jgi:S-formylglutathione hydrolase FrmB
MKKIIWLGCFLVISQLLTAQVKIYVHLDTSIHTSFSGRLILLTQNDTTKQIGQDPSPQASFAMNAQNWQPGQVQVFDDRSETSSISLDNLKPGYYRLASVMHIEQDTRSNTATPGNGYTRGEFIFYIPQNKVAEKHLYINTIFKERPFRETPTIRLVQMKSKMLSAFHHKDMRIEAAVILPDSVSPGKKYPVVFIIPGWGGTHYDAQNAQARARYGVGQGKEKIYVYLNPETQTKWGLHAFVDSDVNGPWGKALVEELIPYLQQNYPVAETADNYFVTGQSSGGYGAAWLQIHYPKHFNGCWAASPDPVDFSNFTGIDLYEKNVNAYVDKAGNERGLFLDNGKPQTTIRRMTLEDEFVGHGGQFQSFEAEFGIPGANGIPKQLYDRKTGKVDPSTVDSWKRYDLGRYIEQNWSRLSSDLNGKVHIYAGADDNFYLNKSVEAFASKVARVHSNAVAEIIPGANHFSIWSPDFTKRVQKEIDARIP